MHPRCHLPQQTSRIEAVALDIDTSVDSEPGIHAKHEGTGNVEVDVRSDTSSTIDSAGSDSHGIHGEHAGTGDIILNVKGTEITTTGDSSHGVYAEHTGDGNIDIDVTDGSDIDIQARAMNSRFGPRWVGDGDIILVDDTTTNSSIDSSTAESAPAPSGSRTVPSIQTTRTAFSTSTSIPISTPPKTVAPMPTPMWSTPK